MMDQYFTIKYSAEAEIKIKGSRFIGYTAVADSIDTADAFIQSIRKKHYNATHTCTAFRIGTSEPNLFRFNDDGEPSGTAGRPILEAIEGRGLTNTVCVVTRYYGGTKLGTGGLARAYGDTACAALDKSGRSERLITVDLHISFVYDLTGIIMNRISTFEGSIINTDYSDHTEMTVRIRCSKSEALQKELVNAAAGKVSIIEVADNAD